MFLNVDRAERRQDGRRATEARLLYRVQNCASVGKYSAIQRLDALTRQRAAKSIGQRRVTVQAFCPLAPSPKSDNGFQGLYRRRVRKPIGAASI
jgi:hypothetical protein